MAELYYPSLADVVSIARKLGVGARDAGLIESAVARPQTTILGDDAYPDMWTKAASLLHSLVNNHPFVDGNNRIGWIVAITFLHHNAAVTSAEIADLDQDAAYDFVIAVAESRLTEIDDISHRLRSLFKP